MKKDDKRAATSIEDNYIAQEKLKEVEQDQNEIGGN